MFSKLKDILGINNKPTLESEMNWVFWKYLSLYFGGLFLYNYAFFSSSGHLSSSILAAFGYAFIVFYPMMHKVKQINNKYAHLQSLNQDITLTLPDKTKHDLSATFEIIDRVSKNKKEADLLKQSLK